MSSPEEVLSYWFPEGDIFGADRETFGRQMRWWFGGGPEVDGEVTGRFGRVLERARRGELDSWADTPRGRLALIVVLDQFSRNVYRGSPLSYAQDEKALGLAVGGHRRGDGPRAGSHGAALLLDAPRPLGRPAPGGGGVVRCQEEEAAETPPHLRAMAEFGASQARAARDVVARFGRHPHRNEILGRASTPEELKYLRTETPPHMRRPPP